MTATDPFESPKLLIGRALEHAHDLNNRGRAFFERKPYAEFVDVHRDSGEQTHKLRLTESLPASFATIAADAVNNLRSALDHAVVASASLVSVANGKIAVKIAGFLRFFSSDFA